MNRYSWLTILLAVVLLASSPALAQPTTTDDASGRQRGAHGGREHPRARALTEEQEAELLDALGSRFPHRREELLKLKEEKPDLYPHIMGRLWHWYQEWQRLPDDAKEFAMLEQELNIQAIKLARAWHNAEPEEQEAIEKKLREVLREKFDASQKVREVRLAAMQKQIEELRKENAERSEKRDEIIEEQLTRALSDPHGSRGRPPAAEETPDQPPATDDED